MGNTQFTSKQPDIINSNISACKISDLVEETTGIQGDTASASDIWFLKLKQPINYDNNDIKDLFLKYTIDTKELNYITDYLNIDLKESDIDIKSFFNYNMNQLNAVEYEMKVYNDIIKQLIDNNICPNFVKCISVGNSCSYNDLLNILTNNDGTLIDSDGKKIPDCVSELLLIRNLGFIINKSCYKRKNIKRPAINNFNKVNFNNEKYSSINCDKNDNGDECSLYRLNKNKNEFLKNLKFKFIINEKINNPITLDQLVNNINKGDIVFDDDVWFTLLQVAIGCYTLSLSKTAHNDLHLKNILIQQDHNKQEYKYIIGDNKNILAIKKEPKYKALIYDFDKSYSEQLCKNYDLNDLNKYSIDNKVIENRDLVKVLVYVYSIIKDEEIKEKILKCFCKDEHLDWGRNNLNYNWYLQKISTNVEETININNIAVQTVNDNNSSNNDETPEENDETPEENDETPEENDETPEETAETPEETVETPQKTAETPEENDDETSEKTAETPEETPEETAQETAKETAETPEETPEETLEETAEETAEETVNTPKNSVNTPNNSVNTPNNNEETTNKPNQNGGAKYLDEALDEKVYSEKFFNSFQIITNISNPDNIKNLIFTDNLANLLDNNDINNLPFICIPDLFENNGTIKLLKNTKLIINSLLINNLEKSRINNDFYNDNDQEVEENDNDQQDEENDNDQEDEENDNDQEDEENNNDQEDEENNNDQDDEEDEENDEDNDEDDKEDDKKVEENDEDNDDNDKDDDKKVEENDEEIKNKNKLEELEKEKKNLNAALEKLNEN